VAVDGAGNLFFADGYYGRVRKVSTDGIITSVAGAGACCTSSGDGVPAITARFSAVGLALDSARDIFVADASTNSVRVLRPVDQSVLIGAVVDAASQRPDPISPGKIVIVYGAGLGPASLIQNQLAAGQFSTEVGGTTVSFNGIAAPVLYASATVVAAVVPYAVAGNTAQLKVTYQGQESAAFTVAVAPSAPSLFTLNQTGAGQAAAINAVDGMPNTAANPVKIGGAIALYATGEGQTVPAGVDGKLPGSTPTHPLLPVSVTVGGIPATVQYAGSASGQVEGLLQVNVQIPSGVQPGGYVPVILQVGDRSSGPAVWIAVAGN
jgi:trimeric autotransporter adhesin